jgi:diadenosine tetraphosphate (Ap4A) HIT family hydrolase
MSDQPCPFCDPQPAERIFYEDDLTRGLWDGFPVSPGHALVVPRRHVATWFDATAEEQAALMRTLSIARDIVAERHRPDGYNVGINVGEAAGQTVFHLHVHLIPRYSGTSPTREEGAGTSFPQRGTTYSRPSLEPRALLMNPTGERVLGHVIFDFDFKFIYKRSVFYRVRPTVELSFARYRSIPTSIQSAGGIAGATARVLASTGWHGCSGCLRRSRAVSNGSRVQELFERSQHRATRDYCFRDIKLTRAIYHRMVFKDSERVSSPSSAETSLSGLSLALSYVSGLTSEVPGGNL